MLKELGKNKFHNLSRLLVHVSADASLRVCVAPKATYRRVEELNVTLARYGGEEFIVILPGEDSKGALVLAERPRLAVESLDFKAEGVNPSLAPSALASHLQFQMAWKISVFCLPLLILPCTTPRRTVEINAASTKIRREKSARDRIKPTSFDILDPRYEIIKYKKIRSVHYKNHEKVAILNQDLTVGSLFYRYQ